MYSRIVNPITGRTVSVRGTAGKNILRNYVAALSNILKGGSESSARARWTEDAGAESAAASARLTRSEWRRGRAVMRGIISSFMTEQEWADFENETVEAELRRRENGMDRPQRASAIREEPSSIPIARIVSDRGQLATAVAVPEALTCVTTNKLLADKAARADCFERLKLSEAAHADCSERLTLSEAAGPPLPARRARGYR